MTSTLLLLATLLSGAAPEGRERLAIVVSSDLAPGQMALRYAGRDAERVETVLRELGGFRRITGLRNPSAAEVRRAFDEVHAFASKRPGAEVLFYYSGHADPHGLLLGNDRFSYQELRERIERSPAMVRVAFLDACHAGGVIRPKGGTPAGGFSLEAFRPMDLRGAVIVSASTATELAQESSLIEGSYFTHHLLSALRGAADHDGNGAVTLSEAYRYTYARTVAATVPSVWGAQHPSFEYSLAGTGELVLADVRSSATAIVLPQGGGVTYLVENAAAGVLAEIAGAPERAVRVAMSPGRYRVVAQQGGRAFVGEVQIPDRGTATIQRSALKEVSPELAFAKGGQRSYRQELFMDYAVSGLGPGVLTTNGEAGVGYLRRGLRWSWGPHVGYGRAETGLPGYGYSFHRVRLTAHLVRRVSLGSWEIHFGGGVGGTLIKETLVERTLRGDEVRSADTATAPTAVVSMALEVPLLPWLPLRFAWGGAFDLLNIDGDTRFVPELRASIATGLRF